MFNVAIYNTDPISCLTRNIIEKYYNQVMNSRWGGGNLNVVSYFELTAPQKDIVEDIANLNFLQIHS